MTPARDAGDSKLVTLHVDLTTETISGTLENERERERPFWGWLELSGALDDLRGADGAVQGMARRRRRGDPRNDV